MARLTRAVKDYFRDLGRKSKGGGRPRIPDDKLTEAQRLRRERYERSDQYKQVQKNKLERIITKQSKQVVVE